MVEFPCQGKSLPGYFAAPSEGGSGLIVLQEWWGLVGHIKEVANQYSAAGFAVLAPDLYDGVSTEEPDEANSLMMALNIEHTAAKLSCAIDWLINHEACTSGKVGVLGFCMGGQLALLAATLDARVGACVNFYGIHPNVHPDWNSLYAPILGILGENDHLVSQTEFDQLVYDVRTAKGVIETHVFPGAGHAFCNSDRPVVYHASHAAKAFELSTEFLNKHL